MSAIVGGIKAHMEPLGWPMYDTDATGATGFPYVLLLPPAEGVDEEFTLGGPRRAIGGTLMLRAVALSADGVRVVLRRTRTVLTKQGRPLTFDVEGWRVTLALLPETTSITVDRDVPDTAVSAYPMFATDFYDLRAVPL